MQIRSILLTLLVTVASSVFAGGDDYDAAKDVKGDGPAYFGFVRDTRGSALVDAQVTPFILDVAPYLAFAGAAGATPAGRVKT